MCVLSACAAGNTAAATMALNANAPPTIANTDVKKDKKEFPVYVMVTLIGDRS